MELFCNSLDNAPSSIVFYLEIKVEVEVGVYTILGRDSPLGQRMVANRVGVGQTTVSRVLNRYRLTGSYSRRPGQDCHRATTERKGRFLRLTASRTRFFTGN